MTPRQLAQNLVALGILGITVLLVFGYVASRTSKVVKDGPVGGYFAKVNEIDDEITGRGRGSGQVAPPPSSPLVTSEVPKVPEVEPMPGADDDLHRDAIRRRLAKEPFIPFVVVTLDMKEHVVKDQTLVMFGREELAVGISEREDDLYDKIVTVSWSDLREVRDDEGKERELKTVHPERTRQPRVKIGD